MENEYFIITLEDQFFLNFDLYLMAIMKIIAVMLAGMFLFKALCILLWTSDFTHKRNRGFSQNN